MNTRQSKNKTLILIGPTASGKTGLLDRTFGCGAFCLGKDGHGDPQNGNPQDGGLHDTLEEAFRVEIVSADSMQAYRGMDIGTAKPDAALLERLPHHLIDIRNPDEQFNAGDFAHAASVACAGIRQRGRLPVMCGGTGFYIRTYLCGVPASPPADSAIRKAVAADLADRGVGALREELALTDPVSAARIHLNDTYRLTRALEVIRLTGRPLIDFASGSSPRTDEDFLVVGIEREREELYARIDTRVNEMFESGLAEEVRRLAEKGFRAGHPGMKAIGYREFFDPATGRLFDTRQKDVLDSIKARIRMDTRHYAKRQNTFFRMIPGITWIAPDERVFSSLVRDFFMVGAS